MPPQFASIVIIGVLSHGMSTQTYAASLLDGYMAVWSRKGVVCRVKHGDATSLQGFDIWKPTYLNKQPQVGALMQLARIRLGKQTCW